MNALRHGQVWWADLDKIRPVVVLTRARVAPRLRRVLVAPVTTTARGIATEVALGPEAGVRDGSVANLDNIQLVPVECLLRPAGRVPAETWPRFCRAMAAVLGSEPPTRPGGSASIPTHALRRRGLACLRRWVPGASGKPCRVEGGRPWTASWWDRTGVGEHVPA